jgi:hypothetical protein
VYYALCIFPVPATTIGILPVFAGSGLDGVVDPWIVNGILVTTSILFLKIFLYIEKVAVLKQSLSF